MVLSDRTERSAETAQAEIHRGEAEGRRAVGIDTNWMANEGGELSG